jgi:hypothetical protein
MHKNNLIEINMKMLTLVDYEQEKTIEQDNQIMLIKEFLMMTLINEDRYNVLY